MRIATSHIILSLAVALLFSACERDDDRPEGPALQDLYGEFSVLSDFDISNREVDFEAGETTSFTALFSQQVNWEIHITGRNSGAHKLIAGSASDITAQMATWNGTTTDLPLFKEEMCDVDVQAYNVQDSLVYTHADSIEVISAKPRIGFVVSDFENGINPAWDEFVQPGANMSYTTSSTVGAAEGQFYLDLGGAVIWDWLVLYVNFPAEAIGDGSMSHYPLSANPDEVYFNVMVNVPPASAAREKFMLWRFYEDENGDGQFDASAEDMYVARVDNPEPGWQLVSIPYSNTIGEDNGSITANGDGLRNPSQLMNCEVLLLSNGEQDPVPPTEEEAYYQVLLDYMTFTEGAPFQP